MTRPGAVWLPFRVRSLFSLLIGGLLAVSNVEAALPGTALDAARELVAAAANGESRDELVGDLAIAIAGRGEFSESLLLARQLPAGNRALVMLEISPRLPDSRRREAEDLLLEVQTAKALTNDWRKARLARGLAVAQARLGHSEAAVALAHTVPDTEEKAFALQEVAAEFCRAGEVAKARELSVLIEENRRYGTYRQKAGALAQTARTLHARGNPDDAATLLAQARLLLPKKPGWSDGIAFVAVAEATYACGESETARALLAQAEELAQAVGGAWKVSELARVAAGWRSCGAAERANARLMEAAAFLATLPARERAEEASPLARAWASAGEAQKARDILQSALHEVRRAVPPEAWRTLHVRLLLTWMSVCGDAPLDEESTP